MQKSHPHQPIPSEKFNQFCNVLKSLSNPYRLRIMVYLLSGEVAVSEFESALKIRQPNLSHELRKLRDKGLVKTRRQSRVVFYAIADEKTASIVSSILHIYDGQKPHQLNANMKGMIFNSISSSNPIDDIHTQGECGLFSIVKPAA